MIEPPAPPESSTPPSILRVALPVPTCRLFDYLPPSDSDPKDPVPAPGSRVLVPFGPRTLVGIVVGAVTPGQLEGEATTHALKPIAQQLDPVPSLPTSVLDLCLWASNYYAVPAGEMLINALPPLARKPTEWPDLEATLFEKHIIPLTTNADRASSLKGKKQKALWKLLSEHLSGLGIDNLRAQGFTRSQTDALVRQGLARIGLQLPSPLLQDRQSREPQPELTDEQQHILASIQAAQSGFNVHLIDGITGSGKTEIYLRWIADSPPDGQTLILVPEIALTPQLAERFRRRFGKLVGLYHSGQGAKDRLKVWHMARSGQVRIVIGTRSAILMSFKNLSGIVVDEEHDASFKQQESPRYNARDLAVWRAKQNQIPILLGSATPSLESHVNATEGRYHWHRMRQRPGLTRPPTVEIVDISRQPSHQPISPHLAQCMKSHLERQEQILLFINKRGYAPTLLCPECGWIAHCDRCDIRLTLYQSRNCLRCHHCERQSPLPPECPKCHLGVPIAIGSGTERIEAQVSELFPGTRVFRFDRERLRTASALEEELNTIRNTPACIIVGTQLLAKGHDFPNLTLVGVLDTDAGLFSSDFRATEKHSQLVIQVAGRAGRANKPGTVILQSRLPHHPALQHLRKLDYTGILEQETLLRRQAGLPPFVAMAIIRGDATTSSDCEKGLRDLTQRVKKGLMAGATAHGPYPSVVARRKNRFHGFVWVTANTRGQLNSILTGLLADTNQRPPSRRGQFHWFIDVDPLETL